MNPGQQPGLPGTPPLAGIAADSPEKLAHLLDLVERGMHAAYVAGRDSLKVKPRKTARNQLVHKYKTELNMSFDEVLRTLAEERPELVTIKRTGNLIKRKTLENDYRAWLKSQSSPG